jgi:predicted DNA-binding transcriptional regulator AlpA
MALEEMFVDRLITEVVPKLVETIRERVLEIDAERPKPPKLINAKEAAEMCGIATGTWYDLVKDGYAPLPVSLSPSLNRWDFEEVNAYIEERKQQRQRKGRTAA